MLYCTWRSEDDKSGCTCISHTCFTHTHLHIFGNFVGKGGSSHIGSYCVELLCYYQFFYKGLLQFGSSKTVAEDLEFVTNIKEQFNFIQCVEANPTPLNLGTDSQDWSFSAIALLDG
ncbi:hypothetical protein P8452_27110 [Trifolium repens]|nr:hypothetical protein P8452_27110 [Trifolium repens]